MLAHVKIKISQKYCDINQMESPGGVGGQKYEDNGSQYRGHCLGIFSREFVIYQKHVERQF